MCVVCWEAVAEGEGIHWREEAVGCASVVEVRGASCGHD